MRRRLALWLSGSMMAVTLSGCVAAVLPLAAAGVMARKQTQGDGVDALATGAPQVTVLDDEPAMATAASAMASAHTEETAASAPAASPDVHISASEAAEIVTAMSGDTVIFNSPPAAAEPFDWNTADMASAEARLAALRRRGTTDPSQAAGPFSDFVEFALAQSDRREAGQLPYTVMLDGPPLPGREAYLPCGFLPPAIIIDLDDGTGNGINLATIDFTATLTASPGLAEGLDRLRQRDIAIIWISSLPFDRFDTLAAALRQSGLDPEGRDQMVLTRTASERKQQRRADTASTHCVLAIAGDRKADFDELYDYLRFPDLPVATDHMIGSGWFMTPQPLMLAEPVSAATPPLPALPQP